MNHTVIEATGLTLRYLRQTAVDNLSMSIGDGVTGLLGPNGAGKTTLIRMFATAMSADSGSLRILGHDPRSGAGRLAIRRRLGFLPQHPGFHPNFTAFEFVDYVAILKELTDRRERRNEVRRVLDAVGLNAERGKRIRALSGGFRQRVALAAALIGDPGLLLLDEPTVGLDPEQRFRFRELVAHLGEGRAVVLSTHQTEDVMTLCQRVVVLDRGRSVFEGTPVELAELAAGRVWLSPTRPIGALAAWRTGAGSYRSVGDPPAGAELAEPGIEDGYLMLVGADPAQSAVVR